MGKGAVEFKVGAGAGVEEEEEVVALMMRGVVKDSKGVLLLLEVEEVAEDSTD